MRSMQHDIVVIVRSIRSRGRQAFARLGPKAAILSGGPASVPETGSPRAPESIFASGVPVLAICYSQQTLSEPFGGKVESGHSSELGRARDLQTKQQARSRVGVEDLFVIRRDGWRRSHATCCALNEGSGGDAARSSLSGGSASQLRSLLSATKSEHWRRCGRVPACRTPGHVPGILSSTALPRARAPVRHTRPRSMLGCGGPLHISSSRTRAVRSLRRIHHPIQSVRFSPALSRAYDRTRGPALTTRGRSSVHACRRSNRSSAMQRALRDESRSPMTSCFSARGNPTWSTSWPRSQTGYSGIPQRFALAMGRRAPD